MLDAAAERYGGRATCELLVKERWIGEEVWKLGKTRLAFLDVTYTFAFS